MHCAVCSTAAYLGFGAQAIGFGMFLRHDGQARGTAREDARAGRVGHEFILRFWTGR